MTSIYGHRGARGERPENTIEGFVHAAALGLTGIECDVALTRDLVPVLHHDPDLSPGNFICDLSFEQLHLLAPQIPTLQQALRAAPKPEWFIEIKTFPDAPEKSALPEAMAEAVLEVLQNAGASNQACILAFDWRVLAAAARCVPQVRRICLTAPETERARNIWWGEGITEPLPEAVVQAGAYGWAPYHATLSKIQIERAHQLGLKVFPWTVNELADFERLALVADGIITDFPSRFRT